MSRVMRLRSSDIVIPFRAWERRKSSHTGQTPTGITAQIPQRAPIKWICKKTKADRRLIPRRSRFVQSRENVRQVVILDKSGALVELVGPGHGCGIDPRRLASVGRLRHKAACRS